MDHQAILKNNLSSYSSSKNDWWRGAVIYQIYPRSFQDHNGDGVGDLVGITQRLEYVCDLGVDAIWLSPFFTSPMKDFGYDVSNYRDVDPLFGSLRDFDQLLSKAHSLGLKVIIDQVISHTSDKHSWFEQSRMSAFNDYSDWYVWEDAKPDGTAPNNWLSIFGGPAWTWDTTREQYYLHNFLSEQPDLNFHNAEVRDALISEMRFWLERGVDGFRLDTVNFYFHSQSLKDNPSLDKEKINNTTAPSVNPYNFQNHIFDKSQPENIDFIKRIRNLLDEFPGTTSVGEIGDEQRQIELMAQYTSGDQHLHMAYTFDLLGGEFTPKHFSNSISSMKEQANDGWTCLAFSNHDVVRHVTRWAQHGLEDKFAKLAIALLLCMRGSVCIYQGEELGLSEADISFEDLVDPYGIKFWPRFKGRDGCRTPMVWQSLAHLGGFSNAKKSWLPIPADHLSKAVDLQEEQPNSVLNFYKEFIKFRKNHSSLKIGEIELLKAPEGIFAFKRFSQDASLICIFNMSEKEQVFEFPDDMKHEDINAPGSKKLNGERAVNLAPLETYIARSLEH
ncbi:MAG: alpha-glucosidase [Devosiaceae bacterium]|nr:alpha-glucosidase [Devosiaceae bacterium]